MKFFHLAALIILIPMAAHADNGAQVYATMYSHCWSCAPFSTLLTNGIQTASTFWDSAMPWMASLLGIGMIFWTATVGTRIMLKHNEGLKPEIQTTVSLAVMVSAVFGGGAVAGNQSFILFKDLMFLLFLDGPINLATTMISAAPATIINTNSHALCAQAMNTTTNPLVPQLQCVLYTAEDSFSWILAIASSHFFVAGSLITWGLDIIGAAFILWAAVRAIAPTMFPIATNLLTFIIILLFLPLAILLIVFPITRGRFSVYLSLLFSHGVYFIGLATVATLLPSVSAAGFTLFGTPISSINDLFTAFDTNLLSFNPFTQGFWVCLFEIGLISATFRAPELISDKISRMVG